MRHIEQQANKYMSGKNIYSQNINKQFNKQTRKNIYPNSIHPSIKGVQQVSQSRYICSFSIDRETDRLIESGGEHFIIFLYSYLDALLTEYDF